MAGTAGLLGVGAGVIRPDWLLRQDSSGRILDEPVSGAIEDSQARDTRIIKSSVIQLSSQTAQFSATLDVAVIVSLGTGTLDFTAPSGTVATGDYPLYVGATNWDARLVPAGCLPAVADTFQMRVTNPSAGPSQAFSTTIYFVIHKKLY